MPIYEYVCTVCLHDMEVLLPIDKHTSTLACDECGNVAKQIIHAPYIAIPPCHQASGNTLKYYGVTNSITGERKSNTSIEEPPGIRVK